MLGLKFISQPTWRIALILALEHVCSSARASARASSIWVRRQSSSDIARRAFGYQTQKSASSLSPTKSLSLNYWEDGHTHSQKVNSHASAFGPLRRKLIVLSQLSSPPTISETMNGNPWIRLHPYFARTLARSYFNAAQWWLNGRSVQWRADGQLMKGSALERAANWNERPTKKKIIFSWTKELNELT